jgi:hypothetical protein
MRYLLAYLFLLVSVRTAQAQLVTDFDMRSENFLFRIKNIEFFIDRFNGEDALAPLQRPASSDTTAYRAWQQQRNELMLSLFDRSRLQKKEYDVNLLTDFFRDVNSTEHPRTIHFSDSLWYAVLQINAQHKTQPVALWCVLSMQRTAQGVYLWSIQRMSCPALNLTESYKQTLTFAPNIHGTDFMAVRLALKDRSWLARAQAANAVPSPLLQRFDRGELAVKEIKSITYHFLQCKPWAFTVQYVNRESKNSGWLIQSVVSLNEQDIVGYRSKNRLK